MTKMNRKTHFNNKISHEWNEIVFDEDNPNNMFKRKCKSKQKERKRKVTVLCHWAPFSLMSNRTHRQPKKQKIKIQTDDFYIWSLSISSKHLRNIFQV